MDFLLVNEPIVVKALAYRPRGHEFESCCLQAKSFAYFLLKIRPINGSHDFHSAGCKNQAILLSLKYDITLVLLLSIAFECILNVYWLFALLKKVFNFEIRSFFISLHQKSPYALNFFLLYKQKPRFHSKSWYGIAVF